ncbi:MAG: hypothetical protein IJS99_10440 [Synergistaceae bacterium]|nr:hypothetical protein [Synergistaceae bacterium]
MSLDNFLRWVLFCAGFILSIFAGYMFYIDRISAGSAWLALGVGFLLFATRIKREKVNNDSQDYNQDINFHDLALLVADLAVMSLKNIGRTVTPGEKEINDLSDKVNKFLDNMPVNESEREAISLEFEKLTDRTRRNLSGRALFRK